MRFCQNGRISLLSLLINLLPFQLTSVSRTIVLAIIIPITVIIIAVIVVIVLYLRYRRIHGWVYLPLTFLLGTLNLSTKVTPYCMCLY